VSYQCNLSQHFNVSTIENAKILSTICSDKVDIMYRTILTALSRLFSIFMLLALVSCGSGDTSANKETVAPVAGIRAITASGAVSDTIYVLPETGWYWNPAEGGRGFAIERQGDKIFLSGFLYESNGHPTWYVTTMEMQSNKQFIGSLARFAGGQSLTGDYKGATQSQVGYAVLSFTSATEGTLYVTPDTGENAITVKLQRFPISTRRRFRLRQPVFRMAGGGATKKAGAAILLKYRAIRPLSAASCTTTLANRPGTSVPPRYQHRTNSADHCRNMLAVRP
jgi:hypothetical protein